MKLLRCPGGYPATETVRRVHVKKIMLTPNTLGSAIALRLTARVQLNGKYPDEFEAQDNNGNVTLPYDFTGDPLVFDHGIRAATITNLTQGSAGTPTPGVKIYVA